MDHFFFFFSKAEEQLAFNSFLTPNIVYGIKRVNKEIKNQLTRRVCHKRIYSEWRQSE